MLPSIKEEYLDKMEIVYGNLEYVSVDSMKEYSWAKEAFDGIKVDFDKSTFNEENNEEDKNGLKVNNASESENLKIYGNSVQDGTPSIDAPVEIKSVGDKTNNIIDFSKYNWTKMNGNNCNYEFDNNTFSIERTAENNGVGIFANIRITSRYIYYFYFRYIWKYNIWGWNIFYIFQLFFNIFYSKEKWWL